MQKDWESFQTHFNAKYALLARTPAFLQGQTSQQAGYHEANAAQPASTTSSITRAQNKDYCWTHGVNFAPNHNSQTCRNPLEGHVRTATEENMMGGNNSVRRQPNEQVHPSIRAMQTNNRTRRNNQNNNHDNNNRNGGNDENNPTGANEE